MAKGTRDLILRDRLQFDLDANGTRTLVYGRVDMSDFVNIVKKEGFAVKEIRYQLRDPSQNVGVFDRSLRQSGTGFSALKVFSTTTAYEDIQEVGIASPDVISILEMTTSTITAGAETTFQNQALEFGTPDLHPAGYNVVSDLLIGVACNLVETMPSRTLEIDIMIIGEPVKLNEADMTEMLTQQQDL
jgi:hypothetical protein